MKRFVVLLVSCVKTT